MIEIRIISFLILLIIALAALLILTMLFVVAMNIKDYIDNIID